MLDPFYLIVDDVNWLARLLPVGVKLVQLRIKDKPEAEIRQQVAKAKALCARFETQLIVNDYWQIAIDEGCDFVHLGQGDLEGADLAVFEDRDNFRVGVAFDESILQVVVVYQSKI